MTAKIESKAAFLAACKADIRELFDEEQVVSADEFEEAYCEFEERYENGGIYCEIGLRQAIAELHDDLNAEQLETLHQEELDKHFIEYCDGYYISK